MWKIEKYWDINFKLNEKILSKSFENKYEILFQVIVDFNALTWYCIFCYFISQIILCNDHFDQ